MEILITISLISAVTFVVWVANKWLPFKLCPICAGVSSAWLLITLGALLGFLELKNWEPVMAMTMGGTVVGAAYQGEKRFVWAKNNAVKFKTAVILGGFVLAYLALSFINWAVFGIEVAIVLAIMWTYFVMPERTLRNPEYSTKAKEIEEKLKNCC